MAHLRSLNSSSGSGDDGALLKKKTLSTILEPLDEQDVANAPSHPIACMQGALEESMIESTAGAERHLVDPSQEQIDSATRRRVLLEQEEYEETHAARWRQKPGEHFHPLWKLVAQISFGIHLLQNKAAASEDDVLNILQTHVDEIDGFLERTTEDFDLALDDIKERLRCLKLPLEHGKIFDVMLEDRKFRKQIVDGNERIEHISHRTTAAMNDALRDVHHGLEAVKELAKYLATIDQTWANRTEEENDVFAAMSGNADGWSRCLISLQNKANNLSSLLIQLGGIIAELQKRAGVASRKNIAHHIASDRSPELYSRSATASPVSETRSPSSLSQPFSPNSSRTALASSNGPGHQRQDSAGRPRQRKETRFVTENGQDPQMAAKPMERQGSKSERTSSLKGSRPRTATSSESLRDRRMLSEALQSSQSLQGPGLTKAGSTGRSRRGSFARAFSIRKKVQFSKAAPAVQQAAPAETSPGSDPDDTVVADQDQYFTFLSADSTPTPNHVLDSANPLSLTPSFPKGSDSAYSSGVSDERLSSSDPMSPGGSTGPLLLKGEHSPSLTVGWPAKAVTLLAPEGPADSPTVKTGPERRSKDGRPATPSRSQQSSPTPTGTTLDIGPTKKVSLKGGLQKLKRPFTQESILLSILYGGGQGERGQF
ncbi:MAG: hypothetical protein M1817_002191 [Caeruleum heppii]|nr:MAG: hypothetical protein M1817_002191 [Caeruleum heppii]